MPATFEELSLRHPCFSMGEKPNKGRIHLPVSPGCNINCNFCDHGWLNSIDARPGVSSAIISPSEAADAVRKALELCPEISAVGVAGPGDALATPYALEAFRLIKAEFPGVIKCMSTNGLMLLDCFDEILQAGVDTLTVTVNAVYPKIQAQICAGITYRGCAYKGEEAAYILIKNQLEGIYKLASAGLAIKVNTVLIPEINANHVCDVARTVSGLGAKIFNIIPLIPRHKLNWCKAPDCALLRDVRTESERFISVFKSCGKCRADAAGFIGGEDFSREVYGNRARLESTFSHG